MRTEELTRLADDGDATAAFALGFYWEHSGNRSEAEKYYRIAARSLPLGSAALASVLALGDGKAFSTGTRRQEAIELAELAAAQGVAAGHFILGRLAMSTNSASAALTHFQAAYELGCDLALSYIGQLKIDRHSPEFDLDGAERILDEIMKEKRRVPHCLIAMVHIFKGNDKEAISALRQGVADGDAEAMANLALIHRIGGYGVKKDERLAAELEAKANAALHL